MGLSRRGFFHTLGVVGGGTLASATCARASSAGPQRDHSNDMGVLVDVTKCIGCRRCEYACQEAAGFDPPDIESFEDKSVFDEQRRPVARSHTVINRYSRPDGSGPVYNKFNCLHCLDPACASACLVSAFTKNDTGPVVYDPSRCMGCRYCMVACPFEIPTYDYDYPLTPQVRKCNLCAHRVPSEQELPACVKICPAEVMTYGRRGDLLELAHERIANNPDVYIDHIYGEHEAGGTSWMWISNVPFEEIGFHKVDSKAPPRRTEAIQHGVFKNFLPPLMWYGLLGAAMWLTRPEKNDESKEGDQHAEVQS
ncbi:MAG: 4Fe-4S dicluster domain-containing protein [Phycisphaerales bacterium]|nr:4Fe-4S dicluster domain-containing protein [Phycisphaerales bacterium]